MSQVIPIRGAGEWSVLDVNTLMGINLSVDPGALADEQFVLANNLVKREGGLQSDKEVQEILAAFPGTDEFGKAGIKFLDDSGLLHIFAVTKFRIYIYDDTSDVWVPAKLTGGGNTTLSGNEALGQTTLSVTATTNFTVGEPVVIELNSGIFFQTTIASIGAGTITVDDALPSAANSGNLVYETPNLSNSGDHPISWVVVPFANTVAFTDGTNQVQIYDVSTDSWGSIGGSPPFETCEALAIFDNSIFILGPTESAVQKLRRVRWNAAGSLTDWTTVGDAGFIDLYDHPWDIIAGLPIGPYLSIYRRNGITRCIAEHSTDKRFDFITVVTDIGLIAGRALIDIGDEHVFVSDDNVYLYNGGYEVEPIADAIAKSLFGFDGEFFISNRLATFLAWDRNEELLYLFYPTSNQGADKCYVFKFEDDRVDITKRSFQLIFNGWGPFETSEVGLDTYSFLLFQGTSGGQRTYLHDSNVGQDLDITLETKDFVIPHMVPRLDWFSLFGLGTNIQVEYSIDRGTNWISMGTKSFSTSIATRVRYYKQVLFNHIRFRITTSTYARLLGFSFAYRPDTEI